MTINLSVPQQQDPDLSPRITIIGVGGAGGNAVNNMIESRLEGVEFLVANTDNQALSQALAERKIQLGPNITHGLGAGARPDIGRAAAEEAIDELVAHLQGAHMVFITAGMGGGTGTGAAPVIARLAREHGILTVGVVTKPFQFEGINRMRIAEAGIEEMQQFVDTLIVIPNQNLFRVANEKTTFADAFAMADEVLHSGVRGVTDLMVVPGLINLDFADIRTVMSEMGKAMMGTGEAEGDNRATLAAEAAISNPLLDEVSMKGARGRPDQHHRRARHDPVRGRRVGQPDRRRGRFRRQHHLWLDDGSSYGGAYARVRRRHRDRRRSRSVTAAGVEGLLAARAPGGGGRRAARAGRNRGNATAGDGRGGPGGARLGRRDRVREHG